MSCSSDLEDFPVPAPTLHLSITETWPGRVYGYWGSEKPGMKKEWSQLDSSYGKMNLPHPWRALPCPSLFPVLLPIFPSRACHLVLHLAGA